MRRSSPTPLPPSRARRAERSSSPSTSFFAVTLLAPILRDLPKAYPAIRIELDATEVHRDLAAGEADIALRMTSPAGPGLVGRRVATSSRDRLRQSRLRRRPWPAAPGRGAAGPCPRRRRGSAWKICRTWLKRHGLLDAVAVQHSTTSGLLAAVRAGVGLAVLPSIVADLDPDLVMCLPGLPRYDIGLWLLTYERLRHTPRVRVLDFLAEGLTQRRREASAAGASEEDIMARECRPLSRRSRKAVSLLDRKEAARLPSISAEHRWRDRRG